MSGPTPPGRGPKRLTGLVLKTLWLHEDEAEALRDAAYQQRRREPSIMREALRRLLGIED